MRVALLATLGLLLALAGGGIAWLLINRARLLALAVQKVTERTEKRYPVRLLIGQARFADLTTVVVQGIRLVPTTAGNTQDTLLRVGRVTATLSLKSVLQRRPIFANLTLEDVRLTALKRDSAHGGGDNFSFLLRGRKKGVPGPADSVAIAARKGRQWGTLVNGLLDAVFENIPEQATFRRLAVTYQSPRHAGRLRLPRLEVGNGRFRAAMTLQVDSVINRVRLNGTLDPGENFLSLIVFPADTGRLTVPYIGTKYHARVALDTLRLLVDGKDYDEGTGQCTVRGFARFTGLQVYHHRLADHLIGFPNTAARFQATLGPDYLALDQPTALQMGSIVAYPVISYRGQPSKQVRMHVETNALPANAVLASLPRGMFDELEGMQAKGTLRYRLDFALNMAKLDSLRFDSNLEGKSFQVTRFGRADLSKLAREFPYTAYDDKGDSVKTFLVGPSNPKFVRYDEVSPYLPLAILTAEDPHFFLHHGFMETAFRKSLIQNIRERRFARGGSTLSMQLVKNVFLTRKKTIARKIEETLLVWIIEHNEPRFVSKERMFEVYLNVIEWGPRRYGITEAAQFFFAKHPSELNLNESLLLTSLIPSPSKYRRAFDSYGNLRGKQRYFFRVISQLMLQRGLISQTDYDRLPYGVTLAGPARDLIVTARDTTGDTLEIVPIVPPDFIGPLLPPVAKPLPMDSKRDDASDVLE